MSEDQPLRDLLESVWNTEVESVLRLGEGEYGRCYGVTFQNSPDCTVVKVYKSPGMGEQEGRQLVELRTHIPALVPQVYAYLPDRGYGDALVMEWLPGQSCPKPELFPFALRRSLQRRVVDFLLKMHSVVHHEGYGSFDGPFYAKWWDYYGQRVQSTHQAIMSSRKACTYLGAQVLALMDRTMAYGERIVGTDDSLPVLLHGDFCFGNLLFDPHSWNITGLIDPMDAEWGARELDLVNVINGHIHHFELVNRYREAVDLGEYFPLRYWFYQVWKWLYYYVRVGVQCREWVLRCGRELEKMMVRFL